MEKRICNHLHPADTGSLSRRILDRASGTRSVLKVESPAAAAAGFVCIAEEAKLISELSASDTSMIHFSNEVRQHALDLMTCKGPDSVAGAAVMLGMAAETKRVRVFLNPVDLDGMTQNDTAEIIRKRTRHLFVLLKNYIADKAAVTCDGGADPAREINDDETDTNKDTKGKPMGETKTDMISVKGNATQFVDWATFTF